MSNIKSRSSKVRSVTIVYNYTRLILEPILWKCYFYLAIVFFNILKRCLVLKDTLFHAIELLVVPHICKTQKCGFDLKQKSIAFATTTSANIVR